MMYSITHYSSLIDKTVNEFLFHTGYKNSDITQANYVDSNPVMDSILGVRFLLSTHEEPTLDKVGTSNVHDEEVGIYENRYALKLITPVKLGDISEWDEDPFKVQQEILNAMYGADVQVFKKQQYKKMDDRTWIINASMDGPMYIYMNGDRMDSKLFADGRFVQNYFSRFCNNVCCIGEYKKGDQIKVEIKDEDYSDDGRRLYAYVLKMENYKKVFGELKDETYRCFLYG